MQIPQSTQLHIKSLIVEQFREVYDTYLPEYTGMDFDTYIDQVLTDRLVTLEHEVEITKSTVLAIERKNRATKKRWVDKELGREGEYHHEIEVLARGMFEKFGDDPEKLKPLFDGCTSFEQLKASVVAELDSWIADSSKPICHFRFIKGIQSRSLKSVMESDIDYIVYKTVWEQCPTGIQHALTELPHFISNIPIDFTNKASISDTNVVQRGQEQYFVNKYIIDDESALESLINVEVLKRDVLKSVLKTLNGIDVRVFLHIMSLRDSVMYLTHEITVNIGDVVRHVFKADGKKNYIAVKESLIRMQYMNSGLFSKSLHGFTMRLFDDVQIYNLAGVEQAKITVNVNIINAYVQNQTIKMYRHIIDRFKTETSKILIFPLQRERIRLSVNKTSGEPLILKTNINFFRGVLYFSNKRKKENIKIIEKTLNEIIENDIALKSFERKGDTFTLEFYPISELERRDLLNEKYAESLIEPSFTQSELDII